MNSYFSSDFHKNAHLLLILLLTSLSKASNMSRDIEKTNSMVDFDPYYNSNLLKDERNSSEFDQNTDKRSKSNIDTSKISDQFMNHTSETFRDNLNQEPGRSDKNSEQIVEQVKPIQQTVSLANLNVLKDLSYDKLNLSDQNNNEETISKRGLADKVYDLQIVNKTFRKKIHVIRKKIKNNNSINIPVYWTSAKKEKKTMKQFDFLGIMTPPITGKLKNRTKIKRLHSMNEELIDENLIFRNQIKIDISNLQCIRLRDDDNTPEPLSMTDKDGQNITRTIFNHDDIKDFPVCLKRFFSGLLHNENYKEKFFGDDPYVFDCYYYNENRISKECAEPTPDFVLGFANNANKSDLNTSGSSNNKSASADSLVADPRMEETNDFYDTTLRHPHELHVETIDVKTVKETVQKIGLQIALGDNQNFDGVYQNNCYYFYKKGTQPKIIYIKKKPLGLLSGIIPNDPPSKNEKTEISLTTVALFLPFKSLFWRLRIARQILQAALALHQNGIVMRNFGPGNVMFLDKYNVRLTDITLYSYPHAINLNKEFLRVNSELDSVYGFKTGRVDDLYIPISEEPNIYEKFINQVLIVIMNLLTFDNDKKYSNKLSRLNKSCILRPLKIDLAKIAKPIVAKSSTVTNNLEANNLNISDNILFKVFYATMDVQKYIYNQITEKNSKNKKFVPLPTSCSPFDITLGFGDFTPVTTSSYPSMMTIIEEMRKFYVYCKYASKDNMNKVPASLEEQLCGEVGSRSNSNDVASTSENDNDDADDDGNDDDGADDNNLARLLAKSVGYKKTEINNFSKSPELIDAKPDNLEPNLEDSIIVLKPFDPPARSDHKFNII